MPFSLWSGRVDLTRHQIERHAAGMQGDPRIADLLNRGHDILARSSSLRAEIQAARRRCPVRRLQRLQAGAADDAASAPTAPAKQDGLETWHRICPTCSSERIQPVGQVTAEEGVLKVFVRCEGCGTDFRYLREPFSSRR